MYPLFKFSNINFLKKRVEAREASRGKVREILGLSSSMNKIVRPTYLSNYKEYLIFSASDTEGVHGLTLDSNYLLGQLNNVIKSVKLWCGDKKF